MNHATTTSADLTRLPAVELAARIARGELSAVDALEAYLARIEKLNPRLNAVVTPRFDEARVAARAVDEARHRGEPLGPLAGVPLTIKDSFDVVGTPTTIGIAK